MPITKIKAIINGMKTWENPSYYWMNSRWPAELPELEQSKSVIQRNGQSVCSHTMLVMDLLAIKNRITLLSGLFHDLGKIHTASMSGMFHCHPSVSADIAETRLIEWGATKYITDRVVRIVATHMFDISNATREKTIRKFVAYVGRDNVSNWFVLRIADSLSYSVSQKVCSHLIKPFRKKVMSYLESLPKMGQPFLETSKTSGIMRIEGGDDS